MFYVADACVWLGGGLGHSSVPPCYWGAENILFSCVYLIGYLGLSLFGIAWLGFAASLLLRLYTLPILLGILRSGTCAEIGFSAASLL